jgi:nucleoid DNA-binding protein/cell division protein FtsN
LVLFFNHSTVNISLIIRDLLLRNEQLVIPGFGSFKVIHRPAQISKTTQVLIPPAKEIVFDSQVKSGDNQLLLAIKKKHGLSEAETSEALKKYILHIEEEIRSTGSVMMEGLGKIKRDSTGSLTFGPITELLNPGGVFALPKIEIPVTEKREIIRTVTEHKKTMPHQEVRRRRNWWIPAIAVIVLAIIISVSYFTGLITQIPGIALKKETVVVKGKDQNRIVFGNKANTQKDTSKDTIREAISRQLDQLTERENALRFEDEQKKANETVNETPKIKPTVVAGPYQIISGSFTVTENAERQILSLRKKGINAELLPRSGKYYMVTLGSYPTRTEAISALETLRGQLDQDLWVMKIERSKD